jgi:hypothetical protein
MATSVLGLVRSGALCCRIALEDVRKGRGCGAQDGYRPIPMWGVLLMRSVGVARRFVAHQRMSEEDKMFKHNVTRFWLTAGLVILAAGLVILAAGLVLVAAGFPAAAHVKPALPGVPFCAPTETVCNTLMPGGSPARAAGPVAHG